MPLSQLSKVNLLELREAVEASWGVDTAYQEAYQENNPAYGNCYPTSWVVQQFFPEYEIVKGNVNTGSNVETHFWNILVVGNTEYPMDFTWQQFPSQSSVQSYEVLDRESLGDSDGTIQRCQILLGRVVAYITEHAK